MSRLSVLQNSIETAKNEASEAEKAQLDSANEALEELKTAYTEPVSQEDMLVERDDNNTVMDEYVEVS